jgi:hypothetical protein
VWWWGVIFAILALNNILEEQKFGVYFFSVKDMYVFNLATIGGTLLRAFP